MSLLSNMPHQILLSIQDCLNRSQLSTFSYKLASTPCFFTLSPYYSCQRSSLTSRQLDISTSRQVNNLYGPYQLNNSISRHLDISTSRQLAWPLGGSVVLFNINKLMKFKLLLYYCYSNMSQLHVLEFFCLILSISYVVTVLRSKVHIDILKNRKISRNLIHSNFTFFSKS